MIHGSAKALPDTQHPNRTKPMRSHQYYFVVDIRVAAQSIPPK
jgi:hypothetical protein